MRHEIERAVEFSSIFFIYSFIGINNGKKNFRYGATRYFFTTAVFFAVVLCFIKQKTTPHRVALKLGNNYIIIGTALMTLRRK